MEVKSGNKRTRMHDVDEARSQSFERKVRRLSTSSRDSFLVSDWRPEAVRLLTRNFAYCLPNRSTYFTTCDYVPCIEVIAIRQVAMVNEKVTDERPASDEMKIDWDVDTSDTIVRKVQSAAGLGPGRGVRDEIMEVSCILRGAHPEDLRSMEPMSFWPPTQADKPKTVGDVETRAHRRSAPGGIYVYCP